jgi:hypothetical protein
VELSSQRLNEESQESELIGIATVGSGLLCLRERSKHQGLTNLNERSIQAVSHFQIDGEMRKQYMKQGPAAAKGQKGPWSSRGRPCIQWDWK